jgi:hypothetical protein
MREHASSCTESTIVSGMPVRPQRGLVIEKPRGVEASQVV